VTLETITHCGKTWMVGLNGMGTDGKGSGGGHGFLAFGNGELTTPVPATYPCYECGKQVPVESTESKPTPRDSMGRKYDGLTEQEAKMGEKS
jgi:hypothetical protein